MTVLTSYKSTPMSGKHFQLLAPTLSERERAREREGGRGKEEGRVRLTVEFQEARARTSQQKTHFLVTKSVVTTTTQKKSYKPICAQEIP